MLTCSPGTEAYSLFGHTAIRIQDPVQDFDLVFNYGTFDFSTPHFYMKFVKGRLNYMLSVSTYEQFLLTYIMEKRSVFEQELQISHASKEQLFTNLLENYKPENRYYLYDFFYDNCATRVRDIIENSLLTPIRYDYSDYGEDLSFRELIDPYLSRSPWLNLGVDLALGLPSDKVATPYQYMFLPDYILNIFDKAMIDSAGTSHSLCSHIRTLHKADPPEDHPVLPRPAQVFWVLFLVAVFITGIEIRRKSRLVWFDRILFLVTGLLGALFLTLWIISDHIPLTANLSLLWAFPLHLVALFLIRKQANPRWLELYFLVMALPVTGLIILYPWMHPMLPGPILPVLLTLLVRLLAESPLFRVVAGNRD